MFLHKNRYEGCTARSEAAEHGHLEVVKFLLANRSEENVAEAMDFVARRGILEIVRWLDETCG